ncbi:MAG: DUF4097 family beta strand repeat-containing protein, partial [Chloroflexota bacterium]|nr:DUF4097 family beta strand repeat-containing protein [Chloroflexota bacterium]
MASTHAMTPIAGTNGYQQQISIDPNQPLHLSVSNASGEIRIASSDQAGVWVVVRRSDGNSDHDPDLIPVTVDVDGNHISVHPDWGVAGGVAALARKIKDQLQHGLNPSDWDLSKFRLNPDLNYDIRVQIPRGLAEGSKVTAKTASGQLFVSDVEADLTAATASGRVHLTNVQGKITTNSASGAIVIEGVRGSLEGNTASGSLSVSDGEAWTAMRTASGSMSIQRFTMKNARLATVSGSIRAAITADNAQEYSISTVSGSVKLDLTLPAAATTSLTSRSVSGSAKPGDEWTADGKRRWTIGTGEPGPAFSVKTVSGSLKATARLDAGVAPRNEPLPVSHDEEDDGEGVTISGEGRRNDDRGFDVDANIEGMSSWAKDFAQDFKKNFAGLATPPAPPEPSRPTSPTEPVSPVPAVAPAPPTETAAETGAIPAQPWTWSSGSGSPPPAGTGTTPASQATAPIPAQPRAPAETNVSAGAPATDDATD